MFKADLLSFVNYMFIITQLKGGALLCWKVNIVKWEHMLEWATAFIDSQYLQWNHADDVWCSCDVVAVSAWFFSSLLALLYIPHLSDPTVYTSTMKSWQVN